MDSDPDKRSMRAVAEQLALQEVQSYFTEPFHLDKLGKMREEYERKLFAAETQLEAGQQAQLDEMQNAVTLLEMSRVEMRRVQANFEGIRTKCMSCTTAVKSSELKRAINVCNARANLSEVLQQLDIYEAVPKRVDELMFLLMPPEDQRNLKGVFSEWLQLNAWRARILLQVSEALTEAGQQELEQSNRVANWGDDFLDEENENNNDLSNINGCMNGSSEAYSQILMVLGEHFRKVEKLGEVIFGLVSNRLTAFFNLVQYDNAGTLVTAVEIVERMDRSDDRERVRRIKGGEHPEKAEMLFPPYKRRSDALRTLEAAMDARLNELFPPTLEPDVPNQKVKKTNNNTDDESSGEETSSSENEDESNTASPSKIPAFLQVASTGIVDLQMILDDVCKCFPAGYNILGLYRWVFERRLLTLIRPVWNGTWASAGDKLQLIGWLNQYIHIVECIDGKAEMNKPSMGTSSNSSVVDASAKNHEEQWTGDKNLAPDYRLSALSRLLELKRECDSMMSEYITSAQPRVMGYVSAILARNNTPERSVDGFLQTTIPEDLFHALSQELNVISQHGVCGRHMAMFVQRGLLHVLETYQKEQVHKADDHTQAIPIEWCVAMVNDFERMYDLCDNALAVEMQESVSGDANALFSVDQESIDNVEEALNNVAVGFLNGVEAGTRRIVDDIFNDLSTQGIIGSLFQPEWLVGTSRGALTMCATFEDYFDDPEAGLRAWFASELLFGRTVALTLSRTVNTYVTTLLAHVHPFADNLAAACKVRDDLKSFDVCFNKYLDSLHFGKIRSKEALDEQLAVIVHVADALGDTFPQNHFEDIAGDFGPFAEQAIARLLFLRGNLGPKQRADLMQYNISDYASKSSGAARFDLSNLLPLPKSSQEANEDIENEMNGAGASVKKTSKTRAKKKIQAVMATIKKKNKMQKLQKQQAGGSSNVNNVATIELNRATFLK